MTWTTPFKPLEHEQILDFGYREFMATPKFAEQLLDGGMTHINNEHVSLRVVDRYPHINAVLIRWTPTEREVRHEANAYDWLAAK